MGNETRSSTPFIVIGVLLFLFLLLIIGATQIFSDEEDNGAAEPSGLITETLNTT